MNIKVISKNKRASYDYFLDESFEAGIQLQGTEVKSLRAGFCTMGDSFCTIDERSEVWVNQMHIAPYKHGTDANHPETRKRKLLLNAQEIKEIEKALATKGQTLIPTKIYFKGSKIKLEIALAKGKKAFDKRESTKEKEIDRKLRQGQYE